MSDANLGNQAVVLSADEQEAMGLLAAIEAEVAAGGDVNDDQQQEQAENKDQQQKDGNDNAAAPSSTPNNESQQQAEQSPENEINEIADKEAKSTEAIIS